MCMLCVTLCCCCFFYFFCSFPLTCSTLVMFVRCPFVRRFVITQILNKGKRICSQKTRQSLNKCVDSSRRDLMTVSLATNVHYIQIGLLSFEWCGRFMFNSQKKFNTPIPRSHSVADRRVCFKSHKVQLL